MQKPTERHLAFAFGVVFVVVLLVLATLVPNPTPFQYTVFRIVLALAAGGVAAMIPGFLTINVPNFLRAGGALAVFVIVYFYSPAQLTGVQVKTEQQLEVERPVVGLESNNNAFKFLPFAAPRAAESAALPSLVVTSTHQLTDASVWGKRYNTVTIDGVRASVPPRAVLVANELVGLRGGTLIGREVTLVARRMANLSIDVRGSQSPRVPAGKVRLFVKAVENSRVIANGADGVAGASGAPGKPGADGASGRDGRCDGFGRYRGATAGGNGGDGGNGENGQPGAPGQPGGQILLTAVVVPVSSSFEVNGGKGGPGGAGGAAGTAGRAGTGGRGCVGLGGSQSNARNGIAGRAGQAGKAGPSGANGAAGEYRLVIVPSFDEIVTQVRSLSSDQLYNALSTH